MTIGRGIIKYIDIDDTNNRHIEIDDRMKPMHDYPDNKNTLNLMIGGGGDLYQSYEDSGLPEGRRRGYIIWGYIIL